MNDLAPQPNDDPRPWEQPGAVRRDCAPHRGRLLEVLAAVACGLAILSFVTLVPALVALPLGVWVAAAARHDLEEMRAERMECGGERQARRAEDDAFAAITISICVLIAGSLLLLHLLFLLR